MNYLTAVVPVRKNSQRVKIKTLKILIIKIY